MNFLTFAGFCLLGSILVGLVVLVFFIFNVDVLCRYYDAVIFRKNTK